MSKRMIVTATMTADMVAFITVPDDATEDQVMDWYRANGASGEFVSDDRSGGWVWGDASILTEDEHKDETFDDMSEVLS